MTDRTDAPASARRVLALCLLLVAACTSTPALRTAPTPAAGTDGVQQGNQMEVSAEIRAKQAEIDDILSKAQVRQHELEGKLYYTHHVQRPVEVGSLAGMVLADAFKLGRIPVIGLGLAFVTSVTVDVWGPGRHADAALAACKAITVEEGYWRAFGAQLPADVSARGVEFMRQRYTMGVEPLRTQADDCGIGH